MKTYTYILLALIAGVAAQNCYSIGYRDSSCSACAGATAYDGPCTWTACSNGGGYSTSCSSTSSSGSCYGGDVPITARTAAQCPSPLPAPSTLDFAWSVAPTWGLVAIGGAASLALGVLVYSPFERLAGTPPSPAPASFALVHSLTLASVSLWLGASTLLAAPTVPWIMSTTPASPPGLSSTAQYNFITAFSVYICGFNIKTNVVLYCSNLGPG